MDQFKITDDLQALLAVLSPDINKAVEEANNSDNLLEIVMDLGRLPTARFIDKEVELSKRNEELIVRIGGFKRHVLLPRNMAAREPSGAKVERDKVVIKFGGSHGF